MKMENKPETAKDIILSLSERFRPEKAGDYAGVFHFEIAGENGGDFTANIADGSCQVTEGLEGAPSCVIKSKDKVYEEVETGKLNPQMAFMMGKIKVSNIPEMMKFAGFFQRLV